MRPIQVLDRRVVTILVCVVSGFSFCQRQQLEMCVKTEGICEEAKGAAYVCLSNDGHLWALGWGKLTPLIGHQLK